MAELTVPQIDFSTLGNLGQVYQQAQARRTLADLGTQLSNGTIDYQQAAGKLAQTGNLNGTLQLLALGQKQKENAAAGQAIQTAFGYGGVQPSASPNSGAVVPNDSNAIPGTVGMNQRLADLSSDFMQDNPGTSLSSGVRSTADQARLYADRGNNPNPVAPPGSSNHERGLAVDIGGMTPDQRAMLPQYGLAQPVANDPPHVELAAGTDVSPSGGGEGLSREQLSALAANPTTRPLAMAILKDKLTGNRFTQETDADGNIWNINKTTGQKVIALKASETKPSVVELFDEQSGQPYKATYDPETKEFKRIGGVKAPSGMTLTTNPDGTVSMTQGPIGKGGKLTEGQSKDMVFVTRATGALPIVNRLGDKLASLPEYAASHMPGVGNYFKSKEYQQAEQAGKEFLQAVLRKDTGAAITKEETAEYGSVYLPQPGDSAAVLVQKKASRQRAVQAIQLGLPPQAILQLENANVSLVPNAQKAAPAVPTVGELRDGYRFKGGNPGDQASWVKAQ